MNLQTKNRILNVFEKHSGYALTKDIRARGIHHKYLTELVKEGLIVRIRQGLYSLPEIEGYNSLYEALLAVPDGIICIGTALSYYELTTWNPPDIHIAIPRGKKIVLPDYPPIKLYYFTKTFFEIGRNKITLDSGQQISIYDKERTICDAVRYRNKIGIDIIKEALGEYVRRKDKNLNTLFEYASRLRIKSVLNQYLDVLL
ncbi:MAG: type IV toxin-antitoxin system AbiEi family antitoxin domain-containing protein [Spirochaetia bacterium]|jgi:predicted transcriptional regulator of viral defense system|nr:type IV toxin-antitoxin system AbiEi family antitoxin domain-containing protein [Spirochaetia bacterium]